MPESTGFENRTLQEVIESFLYTSQGMFGDIQFGAECELYKRVPPPDWAVNKACGLPHTAKIYWNEDGTRKEQ